MVTYHDCDVTVENTMNVYTEGPRLELVASHKDVRLDIDAVAALVAQCSEWLERQRRTDGK